MIPKSGLAGPARDNLLKRVEMKRQADLSSAAHRAELEAAAPAADLAKTTDFSTLPGFDEFRLHRLICDKLGIEAPYFKMH